MSMVKCRFCPTWHPGSDERYWHGCEGKDAHLADLEAQLATARTLLGDIERQARQGAEYAEKNSDAERTQLTLMSLADWARTALAAIDAGETTP